MTIRRDRLYANGTWVTPVTPGSIDVVDPTTEEVLGSVPAGGAPDVDRAVDAATHADAAWAATPAADRAQAVAAIADAMERRRDEFVDMIISEVGAPRPIAERMQVGAAIAVFRDTARLGPAELAEERVGETVVAKEPVGVVGCITPWNYPLYQVSLKVAPALVAGCPVVLKPSELACLSVFALTDLIDRIGLPPGVFNLVSGTGAAVGERLVTHPAVDMITFTGSDATGRRIAALAAATPKRVTMELGGKSAAVVLDGDIQAAAAHTVASCLANSGQTCAALTRLIVPRARLAEAEEAVATAIGAVVMGDPHQPESTLGPLISAAQQRRVREMIARADADGIAMLPASAVDATPPHGYFVPPTVFTNVDAQAPIAQEEVFGPVLTIIPVDGEDEAIAAANATRYGLSASVWSADADHARAAARRIHASTVYLNGGAFNPNAPFGGYRGSGFGRERGRYGVAEFVQTKSYLE
jgi:acyl-CoA reductase-like NAD-dependent aldehyde dehydrogenase